jgi:hypothetical protein
LNPLGGLGRRLAMDLLHRVRMAQPTQLAHVSPDGSRRHIRVIYQEGWEQSGDRNQGQVFDSAVLSLWCEDPYWYDADPIVERRDTGVPLDYLDPYPSVSSGQVLGATTITNPGDVGAWPVWTITGPAELVTATHEDTGEEWVLDPSAVGGTLGAGETVVVTTDPARVRYEGATNWVGALNWPAARLWGLEPGDNAITFQLDGADTASSVEASFHARYQTA